MPIKKQERNADNDKLTETHSAITTQFQLIQHHFII